MSRSGLDMQVSASRGRQIFANHGEELTRVKRLRDVIIATGSARLPVIACQCVGRDSDDRDRRDRLAGHGGRVLRRAATAKAVRLAPRAAFPHMRRIEMISYGVIGLRVLQVGNELVKALLLVWGKTFKHFTLWCQSKSRGEIAVVVGRKSRSVGDAGRRDHDYHHERRCR